MYIYIYICIPNIEKYNIYLTYIYIYSIHIHEGDVVTPALLVYPRSAAKPKHQTSPLAVRSFIYIYIYVHTYIYIYIYIYIHVYVYTYIIYIYRERERHIHIIIIIIAVSIYIYIYIYTQYTIHHIYYDMISCNITA